MSEDYKVQASFKDANGDMFNLRAGSVEELNQQISDFHDLVGVIKSMQQTLRAAGTVSEAFSAPSPAAPPPAAAAPVLAQPAVSAPSAAPLCQHGEPAKLVPPGVSKSGPRAGQPYPGFYACARPNRAEQCQFKANA